MKFAIIAYKRFTALPQDLTPETDVSQCVEDAEARLPILHRDGDVLYCAYPDGHTHVFHIRQIAAFYDSDSGLTLTPQQIEALHESEWL